MRPFTFLLTLVTFLLPRVDAAEQEEPQQTFSSATCEYSDDGKLIAVAVETKGGEGEAKLYRKERFFWDDSSGKLSRWTLEDGAGHVIQCWQYLYGENQSLIQKTLCGNLTGNCKISGEVESYTTTYFYDEGNRLIKEVEDSGKTIFYTYHPESSLLAGIFFGENGAVFSRQLFEYNQDDVLVTKIVDDGSSLDPNSLEGTSERYTTSITPSQKPSASYLPEIIEEKGLNFTTGEEKVLKTTVCSYSEEGKLCQQDVFNAEGVCCFSTHTQYHPSGLPMFTMTSQGTTTLQTYDFEGNPLLTEVHDQDHHEEYHYDSAHRLAHTEYKYRDGRIVSLDHHYDAAGNLVTIVDIFGNETRYEYDEVGRLTKVRYPSVLNEYEEWIPPEVTLEYDVCDNIICLKDQNGEVTKTTYNARNQPLSILHPDGTEERFEYGLEGSLLKHQTRNGMTTVYHEDLASKTIRTEVFDRGGQLIKETSTPNFPLQTTSETNLLERQIFPLTQTQEQPSVFYHYAFISDHGQKALQKIEVDPQGCLITTTFDALGRVETITKHNEQHEELCRTERRYDAVGNKVRETIFLAGPEEKRRAITTRWEYGPQGRLEKVFEAWGSPNQKTTTYEYNSYGELEKIIKPDGVSLTYLYNDSGLVSHLFASDHSFSYCYTYDANQNVIQVEDLTHHTTTVRSYNNQRQINSELLANNLSIAHEYDLTGRPAKVVLPDDSSIAYVYDNFSLKEIRRLSPSQEILYQHSYNYDPSDKLATSKLIGPLGEVSYAWDEKNHCTNITSHYWSETIGDDGYDLAGNLTHSCIHDPEGEIYQHYSYDTLGQLVEETGKENVQYFHDALFNRLSKNETKCVVNELNQMVCFGEESYRYDPNGNLIEKHSEKGIQKLEYDALNRLVKVSHNDYSFAQYTYDPFDRRMSKTIFQWDNSQKVWKKTQEWRFLYDGNQEIGSVDGTGKIVELKVLSYNQKSSLGDAIAIELNSIPYAPIYDHQGSVRCLIEMASQAPAEWYRYTAFGEEKVFHKNGSPPTNPWKFSGKRHDEESGLIYFGKRYYDPKTGRWLTQDPLGFCDGPNRYAYVHNNPTTKQDLYGLISSENAIQSSSFGEVDSFKGFLDLAFYFFTVAKKELESITKLDHILESLAHQIIGETFFLLTGYYQESTELGIYGKGEISDKVRVTHVNGLFTSYHHCLEAAEMVSNSHGSINVHYTYRASQGWTWDIIKGITAKMGFVSPEARQLAACWKAMIEEMGGPQAGGTIFHYAHSLGGTETHCARYLLSPEEKQMIHVATLGSASLVPENDGFASVMNYISRRDGISFLDPIRFFQGAMGYRKNVVFIGSLKGIPLIDHLFTNDNYRSVIEELGRKFIETYGTL